VAQVGNRKPGVESILIPPTPAMESSAKSPNKQVSLQQKYSNFPCQLYPLSVLLKPTLPHELCLVLGTGLISLD